MAIFKAFLQALKTCLETNEQDRYITLKQVSYFGDLILANQFSYQISGCTLDNVTNKIYESAITAC